MEKSINVLERLASALGRKDQVPNQELAEELATIQDKAGIKTLVENLGAKKAIANDCIKVLYEVGERNPDLISGYVDEFVALLTHKNNRLQWGAMTALYWAAQAKPDKVYAQIVTILSAAEHGSVITRDYAVNILIHLASLPKYAQDAFSLLVEQLVNCPVNQLPMYAERALPVVTTQNEKRFIETLEKRLIEVEKDSKRKRLEKVIKKANTNK